MIYSALLLAATAAFASAQVTYDPATRKFTCPADKPNGAFCGGDSLKSNIIIRCTDGVGQPGNCADNLAGYFPFGVQPSQCWQSSSTSGVAACAKNCVVQGSSGTLNGTLTLPDCTPIVQSSSSTGYPTDTPGPTTTNTYFNPLPTNGTSYKNGNITITSTGTLTSTCVRNGTTTTITTTFTTTYCPHPTDVPNPTYVQPSSTAGPYPSGIPIPSGNGTTPTVPPVPTAPEVSATATPVGPSATSTAGGSIPASGAIMNSGSGLAVVGLIIAYFL